MFYKTQLKDHIRIPPHLFGLKLEDAMLERIKKKYEGYISKELGIVIDVSELNNIGEGIIIPGDGASYYETEFKVITFKPEMQEVVLGRIKDIADFGAFISIGPIEGMIHISQTMDDFVSFNKEKTLAGKESKKVLKIGDKCRARIIATSYKDPTNPKLGLTMRQTGLGKLEWIEEKLEQKKTVKKTGNKSKNKSKK
ncbi:MAG TPA: DNA-directed RNA polymerase [Thermodesulfobacterium geofontis]|nr:DNA-directed RNA polymerase [Thermodesulfobacterium geofontis]